MAAAIKSLVLMVGSALRCNAAYPNYTCVVLIGLIEYRLFIGDIVIGSTNYIKLIIMCPVLEEFFIHNDGDNPPSWIRVLDSFCLKRLVIYFHVPKYRKVYEGEVAVIATTLTYFEYSGYVSGYYTLSKMPSLVEVKLDLRLWASTIRYDDDYEDGNRSANGFSVIFGSHSSSYSTCLTIKHQSIAKIRKLKGQNREEPDYFIPNAFVISLHMNNCFDKFIKALGSLSVTSSLPSWMRDHILRFEREKY
ncbi:unnamed protein product [Eruca vesicaria subsp. sativa]|uniref:Uncharacterized protein n=1 Tax=Eruca vesicaria subsp. sativa TaxID=29727 RepID=A0ABC8IT76_ERUVS|nr:unnamed protein product [Eruca vesicaria subsp. sativa]